MFWFVVLVGGVSIGVVRFLGMGVFIMIGGGVIIERVGIRLLGFGVFRGLGYRSIFVVSLLEEGIFFSNRSVGV